MMKFLIIKFHNEVRAIEVAKGSFSWRDQASETLKK